jgi:hypothetical protein
MTPGLVLLGAFPNLRKTTINFATQVCPSVTMLPLNGFSWNLISENFSTIQVSMNSDNNNTTLRDDQYIFLIVPRSVFIRMTNV